jgi:hypothetical protein
MTDQQQTNAMADILGKMNAAAEGRSPSSTISEDGRVQHEDPTSKAAQTDAMADVLRKLQDATGEAAREMVTESVTDPELDMAWQTKKTETGVSVSRYDIRTEKKTIGEGLKKTFYHVVDNETGEMVHKDLGLFETAMGMVKHMLYTHNGEKMNRLVALDQEYTNSVVEMHGYKSRLRRLDESSIKYDVASAKYSNARTRLQATKMKILKAI